MPVAIYETKIMVLTIKTAWRQVSLRAVKRVMEKISFRKKTKNDQIRKKTKLKDVIEE